MVKGKIDNSILIAGEMASRWSDDVLASKQVADLVTSFGISDAAASSILRSERHRRTYHGKN